MVEVVIAEPGELAGAQLETAEVLVRAAFGPSFRSHDWLHALDGVHVVLTAGDALLAFGAVVPRTLHHNGRALDTGYVEAVAVRADQQGSGLGGIVMNHAENVIRLRHDVGALNAVQSAVGFYASRGWTPWTGHTQAVGPAGVVDTFDDADRIYLLTPSCAQPLDPGTPLVCDWRSGDLW